MDSACPRQAADYMEPTAVDFDARRWPNAACSRFITAGDLVWHVQEWRGPGPAILLLHGTGASTHSWRDVAPLLATRFRVIVPDLPGHGFTSSPAFAGFTVAAMATSVRELLHAIDATPSMVVGHSAGAAILARMTLDGHIAPRVLASINGALLPLTGFPRWLFAPMARLLASSSLVPRLVARQATHTAAVERLICDTGSHLDPIGIELYRQLVRRPQHVAAALSMMANWDLQTLARDLPRLRTTLMLLTAAGDRTIPPSDADRVRKLVPAAQIVPLGSLGHLAHEERSREVAELLTRLAVAAGIPLPQGAE
jgi:magnesium chelatase accessory protein